MVLRVAVLNTSVAAGALGAGFLEDVGVRSEVAAPEVSGAGWGPLGELLDAGESLVLVFFFSPLRFHWTCGASGPFSPSQPMSK